ncbi:MAG: hypothetical protein HON34_07810 [Pelagibacteraceae bacterium]|jgi:hypothetical protein|nr:hypothetical protein [Pelagibacteraceae bacterium]MBT4951691.1 hypothetical protein [Pelagibacteraceae bacterium]MBT6354191.1 hypothetical protein [Pelagibacteraceae bacterium]
MNILKLIFEKFLYIKKLIFSKNVEIDTIISSEFKSHEFEKKLALIIKSKDTVEYTDLKNVDCTKLDTSNENDLFSAYRLDFHTRDELKLFKDKYKSLLI